MDYTEYEYQINEIKKENDRYLELFMTSLEKSGLSHKTIRNHISNINFYINDFLCYYEPQTMEVGCYEIDSFLGDWFIRKAMWSNPSSVKNNCSSIKKFYQLMLELGYIQKEDYVTLVKTIKDQKNMWISQVEDYNNIEIDW